MENPSSMTPQEKEEYIFSPNDDFGLKWIEDALLGDIQTFLDGIRHLTSKGDSNLENFPRGSGNLSLQILICTGLELASSLFSGISKEDNKYNATDNVERFIKKYYPAPYQEIPRIFWDGVRNGLTHNFYPKSYEHNGNAISFTFFVDDNGKPSQITKTSDGFRIYINSINAVETLREAIKKYRTDLEKSSDLQDNFIRVFESIKKPKDNPRNEKIRQETEEILRKLQSGKPHYLDPAVSGQSLPSTEVISPAGPTGSGPY